MFSTDDTIVAIATPYGRAGIGVVRVSGPDARRIGTALTRGDGFEPRHATLTRARTGTIDDQVVVTYFPAPGSYTGEDVFEISAHGSPVVLNAIVDAAMQAGARLAEPGEFTLRAYLHGRIDLVQAEAIRDLIDAVTPLQARAAFDQLDGTLTTQIHEIDAALFDLSSRLEASLDFPEEGYHFVQPDAVASEIETVSARIRMLLDGARRGRMVREGARVAILGSPNAGKSTLFNAIAGASRAIVTEIPGTTRDLVTELVDIGGLPVTLVDTAGLRTRASDAVEREGIARARSAASAADLLLIVLDRSRPLTGEDGVIVTETVDRPRLLVANKSDLPSPWTGDEHDLIDAVVSALAGAGIEELKARVVQALTADSDAQGMRSAPSDTPAVTNIRHVALLERALRALERGRDAAAASAPEEFVAADVREARELLEQITGRRTPDDTLNAIFANFCIGK